MHIILKEKTEVLNLFFSSVFTVEDTSNIPDFNAKCSALADSVEVTEKMISDKLLQLNVNKATGPDGLHPRLLKELHRNLAIPLEVLFDKILVIWYDSTGMESSRGQTNI